MSVGSSLDGKVALITGAASGIARETASMFAADGACVALLDVDRGGLDTLVAEIGPERALAVPADLTEPKTLERAVEQTLAKFGAIDCLLNIAGFRYQADRLTEVDFAQWSRTFAINVVGPAKLIQLVGAHMIERGAGGRIVNVSSSSAFRAMGAPPAAYACAKAGVAQLTREAAADFGPHDINVNTVVPGATLTPMVERAGATEKLAQIVKEGPLSNLLGRYALPADVASVIRFLCLPESRQMTGQTIHVSAGLIV